MAQNLNFARPIADFGAANGAGIFVATNKIIQKQIVSTENRL